MSEPKPPHLSRRDFLKLAGAGLAAPAFNPDFQITAKPSIYADTDSSRLAEMYPVGGERTYQTPQGKVPFVGYRVNEGDSVGRIARFFSTDSDLIIEANNLQGRGVHPGDEINIPAFTKVPWAYLPEVGIIRHKLEWPYNTPISIAELYRLNPEIVQASFNEPQNLIRDTDGRWVIILRGAEPGHVTPVEIGYAGKNLLDRRVVASLVDLYANIILSRTGEGPSVLAYLKQPVKIVSSAPGFGPPNTVGFQADDLVGEGSARRQLGHELTHWLPFPWWSTGADEGSAGFVAIKWATNLDVSMEIHRVIMRMVLIIMIQIINRNYEIEILEIGR